MIQLNKEEALMLLRNLSALEGGLMALSNDSKAAIMLLESYMDYNINLITTKLKETENEPN